MGQLNHFPTSGFIVIAGYLGAYSAHVERSGPLWSLGYEASDMRRHTRSAIALATRTRHAARWILLSLWLCGHPLACFVW